MTFKLSSEYALLGILMTGPKHGYEMHSYLSSHMDQFWRLSMSQIYALLKRMEKKGMIISKAELQNNRPAKNIFFITPMGKERFLNWVYSPVNHVRNLRIEFMAKLFFIKELKLKRALDVIDKQSEIIHEKLHLLQDQKIKTMDEFQKALHSFKIAQTSSAIEWLKECKTFFS
jgi:PadR family transcriptional regulator AphA